MSTVRFHPGALRGEVRIPSSKSISHRLLIAAALAQGESRVRGVDPSDDIRATLQALTALGAQFEEKENPDGRMDYLVHGISLSRSSAAAADCLESGSTLRFLVPVAAALGIPAVFTGKGRLPERPMDPLFRELTAHGMRIQTPDKLTLPLSMNGRLTPGEYILPGNISSQYFTGLFFALPLLGADSRIQIDGPLESAAYLELTADALQTAGVHIERAPGAFIIPGNQRYRPFDAQAEGDWSQAIFFMAAGALGGDVRIQGLNPHSVQGDRAGLDILRSFGADLHWEGGTLVCRGGRLTGGEVDASQIPDLVPALAVFSCFCPNGAYLYGAERLRLKESDRIESTCSLIHALGGVAEPLTDGIRTAFSAPHGGTVHSCNDHRILMCAAVLSLMADGPVTVDQAECVSKSYPRFIEDYRKLGGIADVLNTRNRI